MRSWNIEVYVLNENGEEVPATIFNKVVYNLHPSFLNPIQSTYISEVYKTSMKIVLLTGEFIQLLPRRHSSVRTKDGVNSI